jgi:nucleoside 2-deoxyribosyltransferase
MKIFISYKFSGLTADAIQVVLDPLIAALKDKGIEHFCNFYHNYDDMSTKDIMQHALDELKKCDTVLFVVNHGMSEGMLIEYGYAHCLGKQIWVLLKEDIKAPTTIALASRVIDWKDGDYNCLWSLLAIEN